MWYIEKTNDAIKSEQCTWHNEYFVLKGNNPCRPVQQNVYGVIKYIFRFKCIHSFTYSIPRTCHVFKRLFTSNTPWYFLDFAFYPYLDVWVAAQYIQHLHVYCWNDPGQFDECDHSLFHSFAEEEEKVKGLGPRLWLERPYPKKIIFGNLRATTPFSDHTLVTIRHNMLPPSTPSDHYQIHKLRLRPNH